MELVGNKKLVHKRTLEYGSYIMEAMETDVPFRIGGNVLNDRLITNLPSKAIVEVACLVDRNGVQGTYVGNLPEQLAALNRDRDAVYHAAYIDPHTSSELPLDQIRNLCDDLIKAHEMGSYFKKGKAFAIPKMWGV